MQVCEKSSAKLKWNIPTYIFTAIQVKLHKKMEHNYRIDVYVVQQNYNGINAAKMHQIFCDATALHRNKPWLVGWKVGINL